MSIIAVIGTRGFPNVQGGVEKHCENIYPIIGEQNAGSVAIRVYRRKPYLTAASLAASYPGIAFVDLPSTRIKGFEAVFHTFLCVLHCITRKTDVVHIHNIGPGMFAPLLRLFGRKVVLTYHSPNYEHKKWGRVARAILKMSEALALRFSNRIIFVNKFQREKYSPKVLAKSVYIPNGIPAASRTSDTAFLQRHGIEPGAYLLAVGRLTAEKGFEHLVKATAAMSQVKQVVIAGASDHNEQYHHLLKQLDTSHKVIFTGFTSGHDLRQLYSHARLFVLSSVNEGFPLVLLEAMNYGLPLAVSNIPATHLVELPTDAYFTSADPNSLAQCIARQLAQPATPRTYNLTPFHWPTIAQTTLHTLQQ